MSRVTRQLFNWLRRNKPSGLVLSIIAVFIVAYTVITKLDSDNRIHDKTSPKKIPTTGRSVLKYVKRADKNQVVKRLSTTSGFNTIHFQEGIITKSSKEIPKTVLDEFAEDANNDVNKDKNELDHNAETNNVDDDRKEDGDDSFEVNIGLLSENEQLINGELEKNEEEIEENWNKYLDRDKGKSPSISKLNQQHMRLQGVHVAQKPIRNKPIYTHLPKHVNIFEAFKDSKKGLESISKNKCILLRTMHGDSPICIHDPDEDEIISGSLVNKGTWEPNYLYIAGSVLKLYQEMVFLDLGCNIGVYTIMAAKLGHTVVSVDPYKDNLRLLSKSLSLGSLKDHVTLLWNAISDVHENVTVNGILGNIGGTFVESAKDSDVAEEEMATTIVLDDLIDMFIDKQVFIKMDVEAFELKAIEGGKNFFKRIDVRFVLMEWIAHRGSTTADSIIKLMEGFRFYPHVNAHHNTKLEPENSSSWPDNVLWIKY